MSLRLVHRPTRVSEPAPEPTPLELEAPPVQPEAQPMAAGAQSLLPLAGAASSMTLMLFFRGSPLAGVGALAMVVTIIATVILVVSQRGRATRRRRQHRTRYLDYLEQQREQLTEREQEARQRARALDPAPGALLDVVRDPARLWERRRGDTDFLRVRLGVGAAPGRPLLVKDQGDALQPSDPFMLAEARALVRRFSRVPGVPLRAALNAAGDVSIVGPREAGLAAARALLLQVAALHAPDDVGIALCRAEERAADWDWARWLPHLVDDEQRDPAGAVRRVATDLPGLTDLLTRELSRRAAAAAAARRNLLAGGQSIGSRLVVVIDATGQEAAPLPLPDRAASAADLGLTVVHLVEDRLAEPEEVSVRITVDDDGELTVDHRSPGGTTRDTGTLDEAPTGLAEALARTLAPLRLSPESADDGSAAPQADAVALLELGDPRQLDFQRLWRPRSERDALRVPIGVDDNGRPVLLDLKEPALLGMGPHGLCVGATGSGKSELLRTLVLGLLLAHRPEDLAMVLVDYKGGATFAPFAGVPHVAGVITNLADDLALVERAHSSLAGEVRRRQQVLKDAGNIASVADYRLLRQTRPDLPPLPQLLVIIDEFGELLTAEPDFIELFLSIGRIGRSIGVQLLLASQRIEGGKLRGLDTYLSYRLGLRTFSEMESRTVLDTVDAFHLPALPGAGYLKVDTSVYQRFTAALVSGPWRDPTDEPPPMSGPLVVAVPAPGSVEPQQRGQASDTPPDDAWVLPERTTGPTVLSLAVRQLEEAAEPVRRVWLPPLPDVVVLDVAAGPLEATAGGLRVPPTAGPLTVPLGMLDDPARQWQGRWELDLSRAGGHLMVIGGPRSGRSTLLRTVVLGLALVGRPTDVAVYGIDLLGGGLSGLEGLPHVGGMAGRGDRERVRRTVEEVRAMLTERERVMRERRLDSLEQFRAAHSAGAVPEIAAADVVLLIDGYGQLANEFEDSEPQVHELLARGGSYGVHVVVTVGRLNEIRLAQQASFGSRIELRLNEPADSSIDRKLAAGIRGDQPGRALTDGKLLAQVALPRLDSAPEVASAADGLEAAIKAVSAAWTGPHAPPVRVLPPVLRRSAVPPAPDRSPGIVLGLEEASFGPSVLDLFGRDPHLLVLGDAGCGKSNLLRLIATTLMERYSSAELVFAVVDPRRSLQGAIPEEYLGGYATTVQLAAGLAHAVTEELAKRTLAASPDSDGPLQAEGPRVVLLVDDQDVVNAANTQPLAGFTPYLSAGRDIGLHVVVTRRVAGAARGLYEPFTMALREAGAVGLIMSGERAEGQLIGPVRAAPQPPGRGLLVRPGRPPETVQTAFVGDCPKGDHP